MVTRAYTIVAHNNSYLERYGILANKNDTFSKAQLLLFRRLKECTKHFGESHGSVSSVHQWKLTFYWALLK